MRRDEAFRRRQIVRSRLTRVLLAPLLAALLGPSVASAEFVRLEPVAVDLAGQMAPLVESGKVVVAARRTGPDPGWAVHEALAIELTAALRARGVDAVSAAAHSGTASLGTKGPFTANDARRVKSAGRHLLLAVTLSLAGEPSILAEVWPAAGEVSRGEVTLKLPRAAVGLEANVPPMNRKVLEFCRGQLGRSVGDGICATLAGDALKAAGAERSGLYTWGRELGEHEPVLPGDILQLEQVSLKGPRFSRNFEHHTAVVEEVRPDAVVVLQQNAPPGGKVVQRETWPVSAKRAGIIQAYRPRRGESPLPAVSPRREDLPKIVKRGSSIDLLATLDPRLDAVKGIWFRDGGLKWNRDTYARLQVPVDPPEAYTLRMKVRRLFGDDQFGIGLVVGGRQVLLSVDAYGGNKTGLTLLNGKKCRDNESTYTGQALPRDTFVALVVQVRPDSVRLTADGKTIVDWSGDASRLSMDKPYAMPREDWLFLASWETQCEVAEFTLEEN